MLTQERLKHILSYDQDTGVFVWLRPTSNRVKIGSIAGSIGHGYKTIGVDGNRYFLHRLAWLYVYGEFPDKFIDHIDGNPLNNKIENLRKATQEQNMFNQKKPRTNSSGYKGVHFHNGSKKWRAVAFVKNKPKHLGLFNSAIEAAHAYNNWCNINRGEFARVNTI